MYHENEDDTYENVLEKFRITEEEESVIREAVESYRVHRFKNRVVRGTSGAKYSSDTALIQRYLELFPEHLELYGKNKLQVKGKSPADILDEYFISREEHTDCKRWYNLARCVIAIGEHEVSFMEDL